ncbi:4979_t:CDS:2 [Paraglomus occultum]|uniref:Peroxiredoxin-like 2A n=1 Tax=Paraglomus occultum TaxID=144539 RepID=A0A9N9C5Q6_9GLOM|nr:4979_t:CDS:2 [Paraglomus occultum]
MNKENKEIPQPTTEYSALEGIELVQLNGETERKIKAASLWEKNPLLIMVVRRPGCQLCREEVVRYAQHRDLITNKLGIPMIAVVHERIDDEVEQFNNGFWSGDVYYDEKKEFYNALGGGTLRWGGYLSMFKPSVWSNINRNRQTNVNGNFKGEGRILGGLYILRPGNSGIAYEYREKVWGDHAPFAHVMTVLQQLSPNGNKEDVGEAVKNALDSEGKVRLEKGQENYEGMVCVKDGTCQ